MHDANNDNRKDVNVVSLVSSDGANNYNHNAEGDGVGGCERDGESLSFANDTDSRIHSALRSLRSGCSSGAGSRAVQPRRDLQDPGAYQVVLRDPAGFTALYDELKTSQLRDEKRACDQVKGPGQRAAKKRAGMVACLLQMWTPFQRRARLRGIRREDGGVVRDVLEPLRQHWEPVFSFAHASFDPAAAESFLNEWGGRFDFQDSHLPDSAAIAASLRHARDTAPGPDGLPYSAWRAGGEVGTTILADLLRDIAARAVVPHGFAHHLLCCTPKGDEEEDVTEVIRNAEDTRALGLKNSDYKVICAAVNWAIKRVVERGAHRAQRGFLPGRQLAQNVVAVSESSSAPPSGVFGSDASSSLSVTFSATTGVGVGALPDFLARVVLALFGSVGFFAADAADFSSGAIFLAPWREGRPPISRPFTPLLIRYCISCMCRSPSWMSLGHCHCLAVFESMTFLLPSDMRTCQSRSGSPFHIFFWVLHLLLHVPHPGTGMSPSMYRLGRAFHPFLGVGAHVKKRHVS